MMTACHNNFSLTAKRGVHTLLDDSMRVFLIRGNLHKREADYGCERRSNVIDTFRDDNVRLFLFQGDVNRRVVGY